MPNHSPALPEGYTMRPMREEDIPSVVDMINLCSIAMMGLPEFTLEEYRSDIEMPGIEWERDTRVVLAPDGQIVGYQDVLPPKEPPVHPLSWGYVHPEHEGRGLGTALLGWGEQRAREFIAQVPDELRVTLRTAALHGHSPTEALFEAFGLQPIRYAYRMVRELDAPPPAPTWPDGITLRPFDPERDALALFHAKDEAWRDHWGYQQESFERWRHRYIAVEDFDPSLFFVAMEGDEIAGLALCKPSRGEDPEMGWLNTLAVRRPWRRHGLGEALLLHTFNVFFERGQKRVGLGVDAGNPSGAVRLYERAGMAVTYRGDT